SSDVDGDSVSVFFQAEDGIRDRNVTGVQTCALPICRIAPCHIEQLTSVRRERRLKLKGLAVGQPLRLAFGQFFLPQITRGIKDRSEERRVGKECRAQGSRVP